MTEKTTNVAQMRPATTLPEPKIIAICERLLEMAKSGELRSIVMAGGLTGSRFYTVVETHDIVESMGLLGMISYRTGAQSDRNFDDG